MTRYRPLCATFVALLLGLTGLLVSTGASASAVPRTASAAVPASNTVPTVRAIVAVRGTNSALFVRTTNPSAKWYNLGGGMVAAPAVGWSTTKQIAYYVVVGKDNALWVRNNYHNWRHLVSSKTTCVHGPAVLVTAHYITVACTGYYSSHVFAGSAKLPSGNGLPTVGKLKDQGGKSLGGMSLYGSGSKIYLWVLSQASKSVPGSVYSRALSDPYNKYVAEPVYCQARPAVTANYRASNFFLGCQSKKPAMRYVTTSSQGSIGKILGAVGVAPAPDGSHATYFAIGATGAQNGGSSGGVFATDISPGHADYPFVSLGGKAYAGLGAVTIS